MHNSSRPHIPDFDVEEGPPSICACVCLGGLTKAGNSVWPSSEQKEMRESSKRVMNRGDKSSLIVKRLWEGVMRRVQE